MDIETLVSKLEDTLYDNKTDQKLKMLKALNEHHDRGYVFAHQQLITAILRTLGEVSFNFSKFKWKLDFDPVYRNTGRVRILLESS